MESADRVGTEQDAETADGPVSDEASAANEAFEEEEDEASAANEPFEREVDEAGQAGELDERGEADEAGEAAPPSAAVPRAESGEGLNLPSSYAVQGLLLLAVLYTLYFAKVLLLPITVAVVLTLILSPVVQLLARVRIPHWLGSAIVVLGLLGTAVAAGYLLANPVQQWIAEAPRALAQAEVRIAEVLAPLGEVGEAADQVEEIAGGGENGEETVRVEEGEGLREAVMNRFRDSLAGAVVVVALLYFLLSWKRFFMLKLARVLRTRERGRLAYEIVEDVQRDVSSYLLIMTGINTVLGVMVGLAMAFLGMPNPVLWGVMAAVLNYIPYIGAVIGMGVMLLAGLSVFEEPGSAFLVAGVYLALTGLEGNVIKPAILGQRLTLNPVAILLGVIFWGWIWGVIGILIAVPILSSLKAVCHRFDRLTPVAIFLGR